MPRNRGTSRKGKPGKADRDAGMGQALKRAQGQRYRPRADGKSRNGDGGMMMQMGVQSIGVEGAGGGNGTTHGLLEKKSVLELNDLDDFLLQADMAQRTFASEREGLVVLDETGQAYTRNANNANRVQWLDHHNEDGPGTTTTAPSFVFTELSVPRRPSWDEATTPTELQQREQLAFLEWRRAIAAKEEEVARNSFTAAATPFEKNLEVWRQLWRVLERSSCLLQLVDARNPLFYLSDDLKAYAQELGKPMMVLLNKSDYLSRKQRQMWNDYLTSKGWEPVFFSAIREQEKLDAEAQRKRKEEAALAVDPRTRDDSEVSEEDGDDDDDDIDDHHSESSAEIQDKFHDEDDTHANKIVYLGRSDSTGIDTPLSREELLETMLAFARKYNCEPDERYGNRIQFGMVGFPNVGKSSVINVLVGSSKHTHGIVRVGVASQPGKTKHFQTLFLPEGTHLDDQIMLCDCPGLVFPSFVSNTADLIAAGVYPISQMRDHWPVTRLICQRIPREIIDAHYGIHLPVPTELEMRENGWSEPPPPTAEEFLGTYCIARSMLAASSGVPDYPRAARIVIKDYADGKLLYCHPPPQVTGDVMGEFYRETIVTALRNTRKLRDKLTTRQKILFEAQEIDQQDGNRAENDEDLLELLAESNQQVQRAADADLNSKRTKRWGKKGRKGRNKDPYGMFSTPDEHIVADQPLGVIVNAGKYGGKGYTRPTSYAGPKGATVPVV